MTQVREIERRWIVKAISPEIQRWPSKRIVQGYFNTPPNISARIRITDDAEVEYMKKNGFGIDRMEDPHRTTVLDTARFLLDERIVDLIEKTRYVRDGWEIDYYRGPLDGLVKAEFEMPDVNFPVTLPPWIYDAVEVTYSVTDRLLARLAKDLADAKVERPIRDMIPRRIPHIVLTGGPCSGKSGLMDILRREIGAVVHCVPEVATIIIGQVGATPPVNDTVAARRFQRTLYRVQRGFETVSDIQAIQDGKQALLVDRGTVDIAAYLDGGIKGLEDVCRTTKEFEYAQYDIVICLEVPPKDVYEANRKKNPARQESYKQAVARGKRVAEVWSEHPHFRLIKNGKSWDHKVAAVKAAVGAFLAAN